MAVIREKVKKNEGENKPNETVRENNKEDVVETAKTPKSALKQRQNTNKKEIKKEIEQEQESVEKRTPPLKRPTKSGEYVVMYLLENGMQETEEIKFDKKTDSWIGTKDNNFYKEAVHTWYTKDMSSL